MILTFALNHTGRNFQVPEWDWNCYTNIPMLLY